MKESIALSEEKSIRALDELDVSEIGFASASGFDFTSSSFLLISGEDLYNLREALSS